MPIKKKVLIVALALVLVAAGFGAGFGTGFNAGKNSVVCKACKPEQVDFSLFWDSLQKLQQNFVYPEKIKTPDLVYGAISGLVQSLDDPYTVFFNPQDSKNFLDDVNGSFEGIGAEIGIKNSQIQIVAPIEGSPAKTAGLRAGDIIVKINGQSTENFTTDQAVNLIRGPKGTDVTLNILRTGWSAPKDFKITRQVIEVPSVKWQLKGDVAYINLYQFSATAGDDFGKAAVDILNSKAKKIVLDLRDNPGGYLEVAQDIAGWFLQNGQTVVVENFNGRQPNITYKAQGNGKLAGYPLVILINEGSASASEILASALRDNNNVQLVGEKSYGKGCVQELIDLPGGSSLKITVANWFTPKGQGINNVGLEPDVKVPLTDSDYQAGKDPQLAKALEIVNNLK